MYERLQFFLSFQDSLNNWKLKEDRSTLLIRSSLREFSHHRIAPCEFLLKCLVDEVGTRYILLALTMNNYKR